VLADGGASLPGTLAGGLSVRRAGLVGMHVDQAPGGAPATAAPSPGDFLAAIEAADEGDGVVLVTVATRLSASYAAARVACAETASGSRRSVRLLDSGSASAGEGLVVVAAARAAAAGLGVDEVAAAAARARDRVRLLAQIASLDHLAAGGRVPAVAAAGARVTGMRPMFELSAGSIRPLRPAFSLEAAERRMIEAVARSRPAGTVLHLACLHAGERDSAERLQDRGGQLGETAESFVTELSPVMLAHTGEGVSGLAWWWES
jgi:DegV family protein with EDD domain